MTTRLSNKRRHQYHRDSLANELEELLSNRDLGLISQREFETKLAVIQLDLPAGYIIRVVALRGGGTGFLVHDLDNLQEIDRFDFPRVYSNHG